MTKINNPHHKKKKITKRIKKLENHIKEKKNKINIIIIIKINNKYKIKIKSQYN